MAHSNDPRRRPLTPNLKLTKDHPHIDHPSATTGPTSPPETPTGSPQMARKPQRPAPSYTFSRSMAHDANIKPLGNSYRRSHQRLDEPEQLSPRSSPPDSNNQDENMPSQSDVGQARSIVDLHDAKSSDDAMNDADDDDSKNCEADKDEAPASDARLPTYVQPDSMSEAGSEVGDPAALTDAALVDELIVEEIDRKDSSSGAIPILHPTEIESAGSRPGSSHKDVEPGMVQKFENLNCSNETSDKEQDSEADLDVEEAFHRRLKKDKRQRRISETSIKRGRDDLSASDDSDIAGHDGNGAGSNARRTRPRLRSSSVLCNDPPSERIDEVEEPNSGEDDHDAAYESDAANKRDRELPNHTIELVERGRPSFKTSEDSSMT